MPDGPGPFDEWFRRDHPRMVGLARRVIDPAAASSASLLAAERVSVEAFSRLRARRISDVDARTTAAVHATLDACLDRLLGHPGEVRVHTDALGDDVDFDGHLPLAELHRALEGMRRQDRRVGLLVLAASYRPEQAASLLARPLDDVLERVARIGTRLADARRVGQLEHADRGVEEVA
jgi:DNA-directed RNA polymerase specialized sigma24 family protein